MSVSDSKDDLLSTKKLILFLDFVVCEALFEGQKHTKTVERRAGEGRSGGGLSGGGRSWGRGRSWGKGLGTERSRAGAPNPDPLWFERV